MQFRERFLAVILETRLTVFKRNLSNQLLPPLIQRHFMIYAAFPIEVETKAIFDEGGKKLVRSKTFSLNSIDRNPLEERENTFVHENKTSRTRWGSINLFHEWRI